MSPTPKARQPLTSGTERRKHCVIGWLEISVDNGGIRAIGIEVDDVQIMFAIALGEWYRAIRKTAIRYDDVRSWMPGTLRS